MNDLKDAGYEIIVGAVAVLIFGIGIWLGGIIASAHADRERETAIQNAISHTLETSATPLNCKDNEIIDAVRALAENGAHVKDFSLLLNMGNIGGN